MKQCCHKCDIKSHSKPKQYCTVYHELTKQHHSLNPSRVGQLAEMCSVPSLGIQLMDGGGQWAIFSGWS